MLIYCHCDKCYFCSSKERGAEQWFKLYLLNHGGNNVSHAICQYADHRYWILLDTSMEEVVSMHDDAITRCVCTTILSIAALCTDFD